MLMGGSSVNLRVIAGEARRSRKAADRDAREVDAGRGDEEKSGGKNRRYHRRIV